MGIPKVGPLGRSAPLLIIRSLVQFFRWVSERYPLINIKIEGCVAPQIDNLYLDMNGIIHNCTHPSEDVTVRIAESDMVMAIFSYIEKLVHAVGPAKLLFMAVDGPAPRAKINQQRSRRFRSARDAREAEEKARREGKDIPKEPAFDSNVITPGTDFMDRLTKHLKWFIRKKIAEDSAWQRIDVVFSGQEVPGEGEHKIMQYIRSMKARPDFDANLTHCIYGLDADLMMLGLTTHEPNFCLLREEVLMKESKSSRKDIFQTSQFHFLSLTLLREYLDVEFKSVLTGLPFAYDLERVVDDFVFMCFLIGNDFLPNVPTVDISEGGLDLLFATYAAVMPTLDGYLTDGGCLVLKRVEAFMRALAETEVEPAFCMDDVLDSFVGLIDGADDDDEDDDEDDEDGARRKAPTVEQLAAIDPNLRRMFEEFDNDGSRQEMKFPSTLDNLQRKDCHFLAEAYNMESQSQGEGSERFVVVRKKTSHVAGRMVAAKPSSGGNNNNDETENAEKEADAELWKDKYYRKRFEGRDHSDTELINSVAFSYLQGLAWVLHYYHHGCVSWGWYYPYHYAPLTSDLCNLTQFEETFDKFEIGKPFLPYEQLMAVLPPSSRRALPTPYHFLMTDGDSPIIDFYPTDFELDLNGKRNDWEAVVLIPFLDENRLLEALNSVDKSRLKPDEIARNQLGKEFLYQYDPTSLESYPTTLPEFFKDIREGHSKRSEYILPTNILKNVFKVPPNARVGPAAVGLTPTFHTLPHKFQLKKIRVNVFNTRPSDKPTQVACVEASVQARGATQSETEYLTELAGKYIGTTCILRWPHWLEGKVVGVSTRFGRADGSGSSSSKSHSIRRWNASQAKDWVKDATTVAQTLLIGKGLECGDVEVLIHAVPLEGLKMLETGETKKYFSRTEMTEPLQLVLFDPWNLRAPDPRYVEAPPRPIEDLYPINMHVVYCKSPSDDYGRPGKVVGHVSADNKLIVEIEKRPPIPRFGTRVYQQSKLKYYSLYDCARKLRMPVQVLQQVLGSLFLEEKAKQRGERSTKMNLGMKMRFSRAQEQIVGYSFAFEEQSVHGQNRVQWDLSEKALEVIKEYRAAFPEVFQYLEKKGGRSGGGRENLRCTDVFSKLTPDEAFKRALAAEQFLKNQPYYKSSRVPIGSEALSEEGLALMDVECTMWADLLEKARPFPTKRVEVDPFDVRRPVKELNMIDPNTPADSTFLLCDRVMNLVDNGPIPFGVEGSVVGFTGSTLTVLFDEEFASGSSFGGVVKGRKVASGLPKAGLLNLIRPSVAIQAQKGNAWLSKSVDSANNAPVDVKTKNAPSSFKSSSAKVEASSTAFVPLSKSTAGTLEPHTVSRTAKKNASSKRALPVPDVPPFKAYVGNLPFDASVKDLTDFFAACKLTVKDVNVKKGFGFVTFESKADLEEVLKWSNVKEFRGRTMIVSVASAEKPGESKPAAEKKRDMTKSSTNSNASNGAGGSGGDSTVEDETAKTDDDDDDDDFDPARYFEKISSSPAKRSTSAVPAAAASKETFTAFVSNIPFALKEKHVLAWFKNAVRVRMGRGTAHVDFADQASLKAALAKDGSKMGDREVRVAVAEDKNSKKKAEGKSKEKKILARPLVEETIPVPDSPPFVAALGNVHPASSEEDIKTWLGQPELVLSVQRDEKKKTVLVEFCDRDALLAALAKHGHSLRGRPIAVVVYATASKDKNVKILKRREAVEEDPSILSAAKPGAMGDPAVESAQERDPAVAVAILANPNAPPQPQQLPVPAPASSSAIPEPAISLVEFQRRKVSSTDGAVARPKKKTACRFFAEGYCRKGAMCPFKHESEDK